MLTFKYPKVEIWRGQKQFGSFEFIEYYTDCNEIRSYLNEFQLSYSFTEFPKKERISGRLIIKGKSHFRYTIDIKTKNGKN